MRESKLLVMSNREVIGLEWWCDYEVSVGFFLDLLVLWF